MSFDFPAHWRLLPLEEVMEAIIDYRGKTPKKTDQGIPLITAKIVKGGRVLDPAEFIAEEDYDSWMVRGFPEVGDVVVTSEAPLGEVSQLTNSKVALAQRIVTLRGKEGFLNNDFLLCAMQSGYVQHQLESRASGSTVKGIKQSELRKILLPIPPVNEQLEIAHRLKTLSDKVELNRQTNQTLEQIAQAIFKSWFVDFEPTRAKLKAKQAGQDSERAAMAAISGKAVDELDQLTSEQLEQLKTTAALFPDALVDSELGEVPEGWEVKNIEQISTNVAMGPFGSNIKVDTFVAEGIPIINGQQLKGMMLEDGENKFITRDHADKLIKSNVYRDDIVITHRGTLGQVSIVPEGSQYDRYIVSQSQCYIRPNKELVAPLFLIFYLRSYIGQHELLAHKSQVGVPSIAKPVTNIRKIELIVPRKDLLDEFQRLANSMQVKISKSLSEINSLEGIRDALLPRLLSGDLSPESTETR